MIDLTKLAVSQWQLQQACNKLIEKLTPKDTGSVVELAKYLSTPFEYSDENTYVYNGTTTVRRMPSDGTYAIFKLADVDFYLKFTVSGVTYTYSTYYTIKNVPDEVKELYDTVTDYAVVKILYGVSGESWKVGSPNVFIDSAGLPMKYVFVPNKSLFVARKADKTYIYVYALSNGVYTFVESAAAGTDAYSSFDAYFGEGGGATQTEETSATPTINLSSYANETYINCTTALTSLAIVNANLAYEVTIHFSVDSSVSGALPITISGSTPYVLGEMGDFEAEPDGIYEISIKNGVLVLGTINAAETSGSITINS